LGWHLLKHSRSPGVSVDQACAEAIQKCEQ
jgi:hypothetical protein